MWHRTTKDQVLVEAGRPYFYKYTNIKAPTNPLVFCFDCTSVFIPQSQVMPNNVLDRCTLIPELLKELSPCSRVCCFIDDVDIFLEGRLICNVLPVVELENSRHGKRSIPKRRIKIWVYPQVDLLVAVESFTIFAL